MQPVPLITRMPAPLAQAPRRAVRSSPVTSRRSGDRARAAAARAWPCSCTGLPASMPLAPMAAAARGSCCQALGSCWRAAARLVARADWKRIGPPAAARWLTPGPSPSASTRNGPSGTGSFRPAAQASRQRVWVWPASKPASRRRSPARASAGLGTGLGGLAGLVVLGVGGAGDAVAAHRQGGQAEPAGELHLRAEEDRVGGALYAQAHDCGHRPQGR